ncbi:MAG: hypothetical protein HQ568_10605 [Calditrichaeota bacterium]|nr:hypothetical protein [Calditrichota bacterium]
MSDEKPKNIKEYIDWLKSNLSVAIDDRVKTHYDLVSLKLQSYIENSEFWRALTDNLKDYDFNYKRENDEYPLLTKDKPIIKIKPYPSIILKTFRKNIINNQNFPESPVDGWITPENWYSRINDIVRTSIVVKYFDGVKYLTDELQKLCESLNLSFNADYEAREEGYYAAHISVIDDFIIPKIDMKTETISVPFEIQITTQVQDVIRKLLHKYYEERRKEAQGVQKQWQWEYKSDEFSVNYLGHILHYVEGMVMEIRDKQKEKER